jgi:Xaa-Pro aminopeptidase
LFLVGLQLEGAALVLSPSEETLYVTPPDPADEMWHGPVTTLAQLADLFGAKVEPLSELVCERDIATLPPQDGDSAAWLATLIGRDVEAGGGDRVEGGDLELAEAMIEARLVHDAAAIDQMRQAARVTASAHFAGLQATRAGVPEARVRAAMDAAILGSGMTHAYAPIVTVHGEVLHHERYDNVLQDGDLLLADVGAETPEGWASDVTRTWPVSPTFSSTQRELYRAVLDAQLAAIERVTPGVPYVDVHRAAARRLVCSLTEIGILNGDVDELVERGAAAVFFPHGIGHLIGLDVHDMEDLGDRAGYAPGRVRSSKAGDRYLRLNRDLAPGMVVTIEPGFYRIPAILDDPAEMGSLRDALNFGVLARFADVRGIRIEDDVLITSSGAEVLTSAIPKTPDEIEAARAG